MLLSNMLLNNLEDKVLFSLMALFLIIALMIITSQIIDIPYLSVFSTKIIEIAGEANCSGCTTTG